MAKNGNTHPTRIFKTPQEMFDAWVRYKNTLKERAKEWPKVQYVGRDGERVEDYPKLPLTQDGFEVYCYDNIGCVGQYFDNKGDYYNDFVAIVARIKKEIRDDQINGGLLGTYNSNLTARLNGITEKVDNKIDVTDNALEVIVKRMDTTK